MNLQLATAHDGIIHPRVLKSILLLSSWLSPIFAILLESNAISCFLQSANFAFFFKLVMIRNCSDVLANLVSLTHINCHVD